MNASTQACIHTLVQQQMRTYLHDTQTGWFFPKLDIALTRNLLNATYYCHFLETCRASFSSLQLEVWYVPCLDSFAKESKFENQICTSAPF